MKTFVYKYQTINSEGQYVWMQKTFKSQADLFRYLVEEKDLIFAAKKAVDKRAEGGLSMIIPVEEPIVGFANKAIKPLYENDKEAGILKRTVVANSYWWLDSHSDVHLGRREDSEKAVFTESIKNRASKIFPIDQHNWSLDGRMGKTLALYEAPISWRALGVGRTGMTEALFADAEISREKNERRYKDYLNDEIDQHSVGMRYMDMQLAVNDEKNYPKEHAVFQKYISKIGNRQVVEKQGFFFAIAEAMLKEYSAVIGGSNELTPTMGVSQPSGDTGKGTSGDTRKKSPSVLKALNNLLNETKISTTT